MPSALSVDLTRMDEVSVKSVAEFIYFIEGEDRQLRK